MSVLQRAFPFRRRTLSVGRDLDTGMATSGACVSRAGLSHLCLSSSSCVFEDSQWRAMPGRGVEWAGIEELDLNIPPEAQEEMELLQVASADPGMESPEKSILLVLALL